MEQPTGEQDELNLELTLRTPVAPGLDDGFFLCMYCDRKLRSAQALGGHQNAHKQERSVAKRQRHIAAATRVQGAQYAPPDEGSTRYGDRGGRHVLCASEKARRTEAREVATAGAGRARKRGNTSSEHGAIEHADNVDLALRL
ncbi:zinc finger protein 2-like [Triticum urartu]|uniref:zinc finger protein 2-like n=1 Tax=Triticum urartu TaxID=4572 RepID=UPI0020437C8B|nr:zinc finger protein 2-like [Triticum urartu]